MYPRRHFNEGGNGYAQHRPDYPRELAEALATLCMRHDHAVDVGCGTGQLTSLLAGKFGQVTGIDPSASQIESAAHGPGISYRIASSEASGLDDGCADLITAAQAAHWFNLDQFYAEARRIARPGAILALVSYGVPEFSDDFSQSFNQFYWHDIHRYWPADRVHVEQGYRSLDFPFMQLTMPELWIRREWSFHELSGYIDTWSATRQAQKAGEGDIFDAARAKLANRWGDPGQRRSVRWLLSGHVTRLN
ncbi:MAG: class I SAM-dependent methyltransferase [Paracoccus sp. (in: a-proteobacteria)]